MNRNRIIRIIVFSLAVAALILAVTLCALKAVRFLESPVLASLPMYEDKEEYTCGGFQDYTDYYKYYYDCPEKVLKKLENNKYLKPVSDDSIEEMSDYFKNFKSWVEWTDFQENYDLNICLVDKSDYWYVESKHAHEGEDRKFINYDLYFFDVQSMTLYFIHNNI